METEILCFHKTFIGRKFPTTKIFSCAGPHKSPYYLTRLGSKLIEKYKNTIYNYAFKNKFLLFCSGYVEYNDETKDRFLADFVIFSEKLIIMKRRHVKFEFPLWLDAFNYKDFSLLEYLIRRTEISQVTFLDKQIWSSKHFDQFIEKFDLNIKNVDQFLIIKLAIDAKKDIFMCVKKFSTINYSVDKIYNNMVEYYNLGEISSAKLLAKYIVDIKIERKKLLNNLNKTD
jgi:hypothetical protein